MDKLLQIISKLRNAIVPENPLSKMSKEEILAFIEESNLLERMRTFHQRAERGIRSAITDDEDDTLIPNAADVKKMRIGKLRKLVRQFHKATQVLRKYDKFSAARLRSHVKRHRYEEMLYGEDMPEAETTDDEEEKSEKKGKKRKRAKKKEKREVIREKNVIPQGLGTIIINTGDQPISEKKKKDGDEDCCCPEEKNKLDQDFFGLIQKLSPNLYHVLAEKAFLLDICALDRKRQEANTCPISCNPRAWDEHACCYEPRVEEYRRTDKRVSLTEKPTYDTRGAAGVDRSVPGTRLRGGGDLPPPPPPPPPPGIRLRGGGPDPPPPPPPPPPPFDIETPSIEWHKYPTDRSIDLPPPPPPSRKGLPSVPSLVGTKSEHSPRSIFVPPQPYSDIVHPQTESSVVPPYVKPIKPPTPSDVQSVVSRETIPIHGDTEYSETLPRSEKSFGGIKVPSVASDVPIKKKTPSLGGMSDIPLWKKTPSVGGKSDVPPIKTKTPSVAESVHTDVLISSPTATGEITAYKPPKPPTPIKTKIDPIDIPGPVDRKRSFLIARLRSNPLRSWKKRVRRSSRRKRKTNHASFTRSGRYNMRETRRRTK